MEKNYYTSKKFYSSQISFAFFTRNGGFSSKNFKTLNCSYNSGDDKDVVFKNIKKAQKNINLYKENIKILNQTHSNKVILINNKNFKNQIKADGMITQSHDINLAVLTADCCPIFIFDDSASFIASLHIGWKGAYLNIIQNAINKIIKIQPIKKKIKFIIGPCLDKKNFEVQEDFKKKFILKDKNYLEFFSNLKLKNKNLFDMRNLIKYQILKNKINSIEEIEIDTYSNDKLFFSHRRSTHLKNLPTGRMINIIGFNK